MGTVLHELADIGYRGCYRVLDSQHFGVAQRRRRVFGVFARGRAGCERACAVLLEPEGGGWHPETGRKAGEDIAHCANAGAHGDGSGGQPRYDGESETFVPERAYTLAASASQRRNSEVSDTYIPETAYCLREDPGGIGQGHNTTFVGGLHKGGGDRQEAIVGTAVGRGVNGGDILHAQQHRGPCSQHTQQCSAPDPAGVREAPGLPEGMDSRRYRQLGNAVTTNVVYWIGLRIMAANNETR